MMFDKKCQTCGAPATVELNAERYLCSEHAFETIKSATGADARKLKLKRVK